MADGSEQTVTGEDITTLLTTLQTLFKSISDSQAEAATAANNTVITQNAIGNSAADIKLRTASQALLAATEKFNEKYKVQGLNLDRETQRMKQATTAEDLMTSGQKRGQSAVTFEQDQAAKRKKQLWANAMVKGIAQGLMARQPVNVNAQNFPAIATPGA